MTDITRSDLTTGDHGPSLVERLRERIIADAFERRLIVSSLLAERLGKERYEAADAIEKMQKAFATMPVILLGTFRETGDLAAIGLYESEEAAQEAVQSGHVRPDCHYSVVTPPMNDIYSIVPAPRSR